MTRWQLVRQRLGWRHAVAAGLIAGALVVGSGVAMRQQTGPTTPSASPVSAATCRTPWTDGLRRPERFTLVAPCVTFTGTVLAIKQEADGDEHIQVRVDQPGLTNARNDAAQHGALVMEIEPWQRGETSTALGASAEAGRAPAPFCPQACALQVGQRIRVTSAIVTDNVGGHGWNEAHSPSWVEVMH